MGRIWDAYLTESDRSHVRQRPTPVRGMGTSPALIMVDLYRKAFDGPESGANGSIQSGCGESGLRALPSLRSLLAGARQAAVPVVHLTGVTEYPRWSDPLPAERVTTATEAGSQQRRRDYEIIPELSPAANEIVLAKPGPSGFWATPLASLLRRSGVDSVIVAGESTSGCVRATVVDARSHHFRVWVVEECVFDRHEAPHAVNLFDMDRKYADVVSLAKTTTYLRSL